MSVFIELKTYPSQMKIMISVNHIVSVADAHYRSAVVVTEQGEYRVTDSYKDVLGKIRASLNQPPLMKNT